MTDFAANFSARYRLDYTVLGKPHNVTFRYGFATTPPTDDFVLGVTNAILAQGPNLFNSWAATAAAWCGAGVTAFLPLPVPDFGGPVGAIPDPAVSLGYTPLNIGYMGLSTAGNKAGFRLFGFGVDPAATEGIFQDYRLLETESPIVSSVLSALEEAVTNGLTAIDCNAVSWHRYANIGFHSHWQRKARG